MDKKFFVPFETAQKLREVDYPQDKSDYVYYQDDEIQHKWLSSPEDTLFIAAPTYHEVVDWLEEKYDMSIMVNIDMCGWFGFIYNKHLNLVHSVEGLYCKTREEILNTAIFKVLEIIK